MGRRTMDRQPHVRSLMVNRPPSPTTLSFRARTVSMPSHAKASDDLSVANSWSVVADDRQDNSTTKLDESRARGSRSNSTSYFSIPKSFSISSPLGLFARRRKTTTRTASHAPAQKESSIGDVIEIGPDYVSRDEKDEEAERERLRDAAAQALGLGLGREEPTEDVDEDEMGDTPVTDQAAQSSILHSIVHIPPLLSGSPTPPSLTSLPQSAPSPSITITSPMADTVPPYPCPLSALMPYIQTRSSLLRYHPSTAFLALSFNRRTKHWRIRHVILTAPLSPPAQAGLLSVTGQHRSSSLTTPQHAHLHLFKSATPTADELEIDRLEINEDSVVFVAEHEIAGWRDVVKVGGRDARRQGTMSASVSMKSATRSWHSGVTSPLEQSIEEMGRTMWFFKMADSSETQRWIGHIKTAVLVQRAERAGMTFQSNGSSTGVPTMRADLDVLLSLRSQGLLPSLAAPSQSEILPGLPTITTTTTPNPRFAEHVGAAPSHLSPSSARARTYPLPSSNNLTLPSLKGLFHSSPATPRNESPPTTPQPEVHADIDPIAEESSSLGTRASSLLNMFRPNSRASHAIGPGPTRASMTAMPSFQRSYGIGSPITSVQFTDEAMRKPSAGTSFPVDWNTMQGGNGSASSSTVRHASLSLPPPPRNHRRPWTGGGPGDNLRGEKKPLHMGKMAPPDFIEELSDSQIRIRTPTPPASPLLSSPSNNGNLRPPSLNSTSSYTSVERDHLSDLSRRQSRTVPKMLVPPTGPPPNPPSLRGHSPSLNGPPSPLCEQNSFRQDSNGRTEQNPSSTWSAQTQSPNHPCSKRISSSSARSVNTISTGHSFLSSKSPPPPRPPPTFAPPPAPPLGDSSSPSHPSPSSRESFLPRSLRLSLLPPTAPPTHSLPPRPDEPAYHHRRSNSNDARPISNLFSIPGSPVPSSSLPTHPPAPPPPNGPLPPTPTSNGNNEGPIAIRTIPSLTRRLRIMSSPVPPSAQATLQPIDIPTRRSLDPPIGGHTLSHYSEDHLHMFLHMKDTPTTTAMTHPPSFLHVSSPLQSSPDDVEPTSLSPPPRRNSRSSREIQRTPNPDRDESRFTPNGASFTLESRHPAVILGQN